jgi:hypothetical protein
MRTGEHAADLPGGHGEFVLPANLGYDFSFTAFVLREYELLKCTVASFGFCSSFCFFFCLAL